jgi:hypothetical protein
MCNGTSQIIAALSYPKGLDENHADTELTRKVQITLVKTNEYRIFASYISDGESNNAKSKTR